MGNSRLPLGDGLVAHQELFRQLPLRQPQRLAALGDKAADARWFHAFPSFLPA